MEETSERRLLEENPGIRELIESLPEFRAWRDARPMVDVDGEIFWVVGGDQLKDNDQIIVEWARQYQPGLLGSERKHDRDS